MRGNPGTGGKLSAFILEKEKYEKELALANKVTAENAGVSAPVTVISNSNLNDDDGEHFGPQVKKTNKTRQAASATAAGGAKRLIATPQGGVPGAKRGRKAGPCDNAALVSVLGRTSLATPIPALGVQAPATPAPAFGVQAPGTPAFTCQSFPFSTPSLAAASAGGRASVIDLSSSAPATAREESADIARVLMGAKLGRAVIAASFLFSDTCSCKPFGRPICVDSCV